MPKCRFQSHCQPQAGQTHTHVLLDASQHNYKISMRKTKKNTEKNDRLSSKEYPLKQRQPKLKDNEIIFLKCKKKINSNLKFYSQKK